MTDYELLQKIFSKGTGSAEGWKEFLNIYSKYMLKIIWQYTDDYDTAMENYLFICSKLVNNNFKILRKFKYSLNDKKIRLSTYLNVVVNRLCIDCYRSKFGRKRYPKAVTSLSDFERKVFELHFWKGYGIAEVEKILNNELSSGNNVISAIDKINDLLSPLNRSQKISQTKSVLLEYNDSVVFHQNKNRPDNNLEILTEKIEMMINKIPEEDRLIVKLKYWENLTATQIAKIINIPERRVYTVLNSTIKKLKKYFEDK